MKLTLLMAQINPTVGAIDSNQNKIIEVITTQQGSHDLIVFPELALTGYPAEDLLYRTELHQAVRDSLEHIRAITQDCYSLVGHPIFEHDKCYNCVSIFYKGEKIREYRKQNLPNYDVFDEERYFTAGPKDPCILNIKDQRVGVCICEDLWQPGPVDDLLASGIDVLVSLNASPFDYSKYAIREELLLSYANQGVAVIYVNQICGQDELLFDGQSLAIDATGSICARSPAFEEDLHSVQINNKQIIGQVTPLLSQEALIYKALVYGTKDFVEKNKFPGVLIGLSGGIDSALTVAIAVDALGADRVQAVMMPSRYSAALSTQIAMEQIHTLKISETTLSIEPVFESFLTTLEPVFKHFKPDSSEENLQARIRGTLLMALSNKTGHMVLTTSNKSESAVGYATLYGDMVGGLAVLKDVLKTQVYALAHYRNSISNVIPEQAITRAPSAELKEDQTDQQSLPEYSIVDAIITAYMEDNLSPEAIIKLGFEAKDVIQITQLIQKSEYKRRQSAPGIKISPIAFGKDWRYPITNGFISSKN